MIEKISVWTPVVQNNTNRNETLSYLRVCDEMLDWGGRTVNIIRVGPNGTHHVEYNDAPSDFIERAFKIICFALAMFTIIIPLGKLFYRLANDFVVIAPNARTTPPPETPTDEIQTVDIASKFDELSKSNEYLTGYLNSIDRFLQEIPIAENEDNGTALFYIHRLLCELASTIDVYEEQTLYFAKKLDKEDISNISGTMSNTVIKHYKETRDALKAKVQQAAPSLQKVVAGYEKKFDNLDGHSQEFMAYFLDFITEYFDWTTYKQTLAKNPKLAKLSAAPIKHAVGIQNQGNSCWLNACVQSLFAAQPILNRLAQKVKEIDKQPEQLRRVIASLDTLRDCMTNGCTDPALLGQVCAQLRLALFNGMIQDYEAQQINAFQDPGPLYRLVMKTLGLEFDLNFIRSAVEITYIAAGKTNENIIAISTERKSIQETVNTLASGVVVDADGWKTNTGQVIQRAKETSTIQGYPPGILIFRVKEKYQQGSVIQGDHSIQRADLEIDMSQMLFPNNAKYRLVGFAQNRSRVHWVAYALRDGIWRLFNDSTVTDNPTIIGKKAHYLIYERIDN